MKHFYRYLLVLLLACTFIGCSGNDSPSGTSNKQSEEDYKLSNGDYQLSEEDYTSLTELPVLSIETASRTDSVMDFVTKPVTSHVAKSIASWTPFYEMPPEPYYEPCTVSLTGDNSSVLLDAVNAEVKVRGNWTTSYDKKPLRIKFEEAQSLLGLNEGATFKNWLLLAEYKDASMLRNKTMLSLANELLEDSGLYAADAAFVEVVINGNYWGVYLLTELQQINHDRVDITEAEAGYTGTDIGYFMEFDGYYMNEDPLHQFHVDFADNAALVPFDGNDGSGRTMKCLSDPAYGFKKDIGISIKSDIYSEEQRDFIASYVNNVYRIMYSAAYRNEAYQFNSDYTSIAKTTALTPREAVEQVVDIQSLVNVYILHELACDADVYWSSFYMSADFGPDGNKKLTFQAPWDFDSALGNKNRCIDGTGFYAANIVPDVNGGPYGGGDYETINPWLAVLIYEEWFQDKVKDTWTAFYDSGAFERTCKIIENVPTQYQDAFTRNYDRWNNILDNSSFVNELSAPSAACQTHAEAAEFLLKWLQSRVEFLNTEWHR